ncbi:MFS transporter [Balneolales bacterium ANBcel1]|nr:MFS transporter [Balneolales bacterium ANBcel1]
MTEPVHRWIFIVSCSAMLVFGIVMTILGTVLPSVIARFQISNAEAGTLFVFFSSGLLGGSLVFGPVADRFGYKWLLSSSLLLAAMGLFGIAFSPTYPVLGTALVICGFAGAAINGGTNALVSDISEGKRGARLALLSVFFGIGAFGVPLIFGSLLDRFPFEGLISAIAVTVLIPLGLILSLRFPPPKHEHGFPVAEGLGLLKEKTLLLFGLILVIQGGLEMSMGGWSAAYFTDILQVSSSRAVLSLSLFWFGVTLMRMLLSFLLLRFPATAIMYVSYLCAFTGSLVLLSTSSPAIALAGIILTGAGLAAAFPVVLAYVGDLYRHLSGTAFSIILVMALAGNITMPFLIGQLSEAFDLRIALILVPVGILLCLALFGISERRVKSAL